MPLIVIVFVGISQIPGLIAFTNLVGIDESWDIKNKGENDNRDNILRQVSPKGNCTYTNTILVGITDRKMSLPGK